MRFFTEENSLCVNLVSLNLEYSGISTQEFKDIVESMYTSWIPYTTIFMIGLRYRYGKNPYPADWKDLITICNKIGCHDIPNDIYYMAENVNKQTFERLSKVINKEGVEPIGIISSYINDGIVLLMGLLGILSVLWIIGVY